ncbi:diacylglycerol/lipid kinase family protein [Propioniciclava tarda]|uniref:YegS/Rv2252/BmrU family lipid kinase n=1 Tax=Propioniciclava tarda TaxID=433330 RepID=A0A4Q9KJD5_PROTD|nr:YegS/Rv2252/BmrU family lipid kinase [Propioniciclava tarda]TBT94562.1 YegS/Rv2252/BmrU family lipid kinase [Propioniciclava tarda]SMO68471.1 diacylglycerol kinase (ATP) [Propioniciclava tarda]
MTEVRRRLTLLVNPSSGRGKARRLLPRVVAELGRLLPDADVTVRLTTDYADARAQASRVIGEASGSDGLLMMGGDGMTSIGLNAAAQSGVPLGIVPAGTGNDFCRGVGLPTTVDQALAVIAAGHTEDLDLMSVDGELVDGSQRRWVGSILSSGFDEKVNWRNNHLPISLGAPSYAYSVIIELAKFKPLAYRIEIDGVPRELDSILIAVGNAGVFGGGMKGCPDADVRDGLLDVTIVHPVGRGTLIKLLPRLFDGTFAKHPAVELLRATEVGIDGDGLFGMADGEELGRPPFTCRAVPGAIRLYTPAPAWPS